MKNWFPFWIDLFRFFRGDDIRSTVYYFRNGLKLRIHDKSKRLNIVFYEIFLKNIYDGRPEFHINHNDVIVDIGAHLGFFSIKSSQLAKNGMVYALEPFSLHYKLLRDNVSTNNIKNIKLFNVALSSSSCPLEFFYTLQGEPGDTSLYVLDAEKKLHKEIVNSITLDEFFKNENISKCDFMKLDCEGAEYDILFNSSDETISKINRIAMEWHRFVPEHEPRKMENFLRDKGFKVFQEGNYTQKAGLMFAIRQ